MVASALECAGAHITAWALGYCKLVHDYDCYNAICSGRPGRHARLWPYREDLQTVTDSPFGENAGDYRRSDLGINGRMDLANNSGSREAKLTSNDEPVRDIVTHRYSVSP